MGSVKAIEAWPNLCFPIGLAMLLSVVINLSAVGLFVRPYAAYAIVGFDRENFLTNRVNGYPAVAWLNQQNEIEARVGRVESRTLWKQMRDLKISHILTDWPTSMSPGDSVCGFSHQGDRWSRMSGSCKGNQNPMANIKNIGIIG